MEESINLFLSTHRPLVITLGGVVLFTLIIVPIIKDYFFLVMIKERKNIRVIKKNSEELETNSKKDNRLIIFLRIAFILIFIVLPIVWSAFNDNDSSSQKETFYGYECQTSDCGGHKAGYEWAENKNITEYENCGGNSESFIEGCKSYVSGEYNFGNNE